MTCENCIHFNICNENADGNIVELMKGPCFRFKDKDSLVEVKNGRWLSMTDCANAGVYCSECLKKVYKEDYAWANRKNKLRSAYCPNCGAKMDGERKENEPD